MTSKCGPCSFRAMDHDSLVWCLVCKEGLCSDCKEHHTALKVLKSHEIIPYENLRKLPQIAQDIRETCFEHDRKFEIYCSHHLESCCIKCSTSFHKSCSNTIPLDDVICDVKSSVAMRRIEEELSGLISKAETIIENKESSMHLVEDQTANLKKDIQDMRERIEKTIGEQFKKIENKIDERKTEDEMKTNDAITKLKENIKTAQNLRVTIAQIKESASNLQIFLFLKELESMVSNEENRLSTILEKGVLDNMTLRFIPSEQFEKLVSIGCIGDIDCEIKPRDICFGSHGQSGMKIEFKEPRSIDIGDVKLEKRKEMSFTETSTMVTNCVVLYNGSMLFSDFSDKSRLILYDANGNFLRYIKVESKPFDLVVINESVVVVTLPKARKVLFMDLNHDDFVRSLSTVGECYEIDHVANRFAVSVQGFSIKIFDDEGILIRTIPLVCTTLVFLKSNICYLKDGSNMLRCCDRDGRNMWELPVHHFLDYSSMTIDEYGNIYITEMNSDQVFIVAEDGARYRKILQQSDGLWNCIEWLSDIAAFQCIEWLSDIAAFQSIEWLSDIAAFQSIKWLSDLASFQSIDWLWDIASFQTIDWLSDITSFQSIDGLSDIAAFQSIDWLSDIASFQSIEWLSDIIKTIPLACTTLVFLKSNICYVKAGSNVLRCCDLEGSNMWELPLIHFYDYPSMTIDAYGNIYIAERNSDRVFIVTEDGARNRQLLQQSDGLCDVNGIFINTKKQQLLLCTKRDKMVVLYDVSIRPRDEDI